MEESVNNESREEIFSRTVRAGKRTYFFDVKATRSNEQYITITESKRRFNNEQGKFFYEKHKLFLYKEDFEKFRDGLSDVMIFIDKNIIPLETDIKTEIIEETHINNDLTNVDFEDLQPITEKQEIESSEKRKK